MHFGSAFERRQADLFLQALAGLQTHNVRRQPRADERAWLETPDAEDFGEDTFTPENLAADLKGLEFVLVADGDIKVAGKTARHAAGTVVTVVTWDNARTGIDATIGGAKAIVDKSLLAPKVSMYKATVTTAKGSRDVAIPLYVTDAAQIRAAIQKGKASGTDQSNNYKQLNKHLIVETMMNRFDQHIGRWTTAYDALIGDKHGWVPLAPGWVKSMMVQESTAGTAGKYLVERSAVMTRFNVLQAVDSWGPQQFLMMKEIEPGLLKSKGLDKVMDHQAALEEEWTRLDNKKTRSSRQQKRLDELDKLRFNDAAARRSPTWGPFFRKYPDVDITPKPAAKAKYWDVVVSFLESGSPKRKYDYSFWIRTGVRWLFEKRKGVSTWSDAVRAFNGVGGRAEFYRAIVLTRARAAAGAAGIVDEVWGGYNCPKEAKTRDGAFRVCAFERIANVCEPRC